MAAKSATARAAARSSAPKRAAGPVGQQRQPERLLVGHQRHVEGLVGPAPGRRDGLRPRQRLGPGLGARVDAGRQRAAVDHARGSRAA